MKKYIILVLLMLIYIGNSYSQIDTVIIVKTDTVLVPEKQDRLYKFFVENKETETKHLWKMNLVDIALFKPNIVYEQRLAKLWSVEGYIRYGYGSGIGTINGKLITSEHHSSNATIEFEQLFKYYYNLNRRERRGKKTNGFSGNYFASSIWINEYRDPLLETDSTSSSGVDNKNIGIKYGIQRRIGNLGYIEIYAGIYYRWETIHQSLKNASPGTYNNDYNDFNNMVMPRIGIKAGFAIGSFDNLKRRIKD
jgi:hypothetical protein